VTTNDEKPNGLLPNTFQTPNVLVDRLMPLLEDSELRVLLFAIRHIYGWRGTNAERQARISLTAFEKGYRGSAGCGLHRPAIQAALKRLTAFRIMRPIGEATRKGQMWALTEHSEDIAWGKLEARAQKKAKSGQKQVAKAAQARRRQKPGNGTSNVPPVRSTNQSTGTSDEPSSGTSNVPDGGTSNVPETGTSNVPIETHIETHSLKPRSETQSSSSNESDNRDKSAVPDSPPVDDEKQFVRVEAEKLGLTQDWRERLLTLETNQAIGLMLHARRKGHNPAGLLITLLRVEQPPPEDMLALVPLALEMRTLDVKALEAERRRREYESLQSQARQIAETRQTQEERVKSTPEQGGEGLDERPGGGGLSWRNIWQAEMGQLSLMLNKSTFAAIRTVELAGVEGDVLKLRAPSALAQQQLGRLRETIEQQLEQMTGIPVRIQVNGVTHGKSTHGTDPDAAGNVAPDRSLPADAPLRADDAGRDGERAGHQLDERGELHDEQTAPSGAD